MQSLQLGGVFSAIQFGLPAGFAALIIGLQPIVIASVVGPLGERVSPRQWGASSWALAVLPWCCAP